MNCDMSIYTLIENLEIRNRVGFDKNEFKDLNIIHIGNDEELAFRLLTGAKKAYHIFCAYQKVELYQKLIDKMIEEKQHYGILSEAPCNMSPYPMHILKELYHTMYLPLKLHKIINHSDFIINCSGYYDTELQKIGWKQEQIISCGYFSPRIPGSQCVKRNKKHHKDFTILLSGLHEWHRSPWLLLKALNILKKEGLTPKCYITQEGPYISSMKKYAKKNALDNVYFLGFVEMSELIKLYENCSVYIGGGNYEPWGMRLNDALQCGAPLIVNRGMGGCKLVDSFKCGATFNRNDYRGLAEEIRKLLNSEEVYMYVAENAFNAASVIAPEEQAKIYAPQIINKMRKS